MRKFSQFKFEIKNQMNETYIACCKETKVVALYCLLFGNKNQTIPEMEFTSALYDLQ